MEHTPGPWEAEVLDRGTHTNLRSGGYHVITVIQSPNMAQPCKLANARLIAAAPDLLDALEGLVENIPHHDSVSWDKAHAAIAKAKGEA